MFAIRLVPTMRGRSERLVWMNRRPHRLFIHTSRSLRPRLDSAQAAEKHQEQTAEQADGNRAKDDLRSYQCEQQTSKGCPKRLAAITEIAKGAVHPTL